MEEENSGISKRIKFPNKFFYSIEYPGYVVNIDKALKTLGGSDNISNHIATSDKDPVELRYEPNNKSLLPLLGEVVPTNNVLIKIKRKIKKYKDGRIEELEPEKNSWDVEIVGWINKTVRFRGILN
ncbi:General transcription factor 3C polypeptide 5 [Smittium culicis]|uniref:General transcription factor 3C polypeptide 5 n=1 Tax=Smittium culicis TaxID=133412 RepID=A0A1R1XXW1_9FUNG|nr:General transcription factor 3C polypeptide 5 [Smittium culicis]